MKFTFRADPLQKAFWGTLDFEVNFTGRGYPRQKYLRGLLDNPVKFTFRADPLQKAFWGRLPCEVNFTGRCYPCQKAFWGLLDPELVQEG